VKPGVLLLPAVLSCLLMAAHVLRSGMIVVTAGFALLPIALLARRSWVPVILQLVLLGAAAEWMRTAVVLVRGRIVGGEPWARLAVILGAVIAMTLGSVLALGHPEIRRRYGRS
jgi:hypothetical protein